MEELTFGPGKFGPQEPGGYYRCGFWREEYTVLAIGVTEIIVVWANGEIERHMTPWHNRCDRVLA